MPYAEPPIKKVKVTDLRLDLDNFRFPSAHLSDQAAMNFLFEEHNVLDVARLILRSGYFDNEIPLVVPESDGYVILEGNRRVSALRALLNPSLVPARQAELQRLLKRYSPEAANLPGSIRVMVVESREEAAPHLARLHVGENKKAWDLDEQAKFVLAQLGDGVDVAKLKDLLPGVPSVPRLVRMGRMRQLLHETQFTDPEIRDFADGDDLKMSAFEYAYKDRQIQLLTGIAFGPDGNLTDRPSTPAHVAVLERLLQGFKSGELSTRKVLNAKKGQEYADLLAELRNIASGPANRPDDDPLPAPPGPDDDPGYEPGTAGTPSNPGPTPGGDGPTPPPSGQPAPTPRGPNSPDSKNKLIIGFNFSGASPGIQKRLVELRSIDISTHSIAAAMLLRSVLESAIKDHYAQRSQRVEGMLGQIAPTLDRDYGQIGYIKRAIKMLTNSITKGDPGSGDWFNTVSHSPHIAVSAQDVRDAWQEQQALVRFLLQPPGTSTS